MGRQIGQWLICGGAVVGLAVVVTTIIQIVIHIFFEDDRKEEEAVKWQNPIQPMFQSSNPISRWVDPTLEWLSGIPQRIRKECTLIVVICQDCRRFIRIKRGHGISGRSHGFCRKCREVRRKEILARIHSGGLK